MATKLCLLYFLRLILFSKLKIKGLIARMLLLEKNNIYLNKTRQRGQILLVLASNKNQIISTYTTINYIKMKRIYLIITLFTLSLNIFAQTVEIDQALLFSRTDNNTGTARASAMGGAFGALGGEFSSLSINPAGIAVFRSSEITLTPTFIIDNQQNNGITQETNKFTFSNVGYISSVIPRIPEDGWQNWSFGIGYNNIANFNGEYVISNKKSKSSILDSWIAQAEGYEPDNLFPFNEQLAYQTYLINRLDDKENKYVSALGEIYKMDQEKTQINKGYIGEYILSFGANYKHKLYVGATLGIQDVYYKTRTYHTEYAVKDNISSLDNFTYGTFNETDGIGVNLKLGAIYRPYANLRLGFALHTPTYYNLNTEMETFLDSYFDKNIKEGFPEDGKASHNYISEYLETSNYKFRTPLRLIFSGAYTFAKRIALSIDYELINYSSSKYKSGDIEWDNGEDIYAFNRNYNRVNSVINDTYQATSNLRVGTEIKVTPQFSIRGGYAHIGDAFKGDYNESYDIFSGGFGYRYKNTFVDASVQHKDYSEDLLLYADSDTIILDKNKTNFKLTIGYRF